jgi:hypothetical protein
MTVAEMFARMDSEEFGYWQAIHRYHWPIGGEWEQAGMVASAALAPYCPRGKTLKASDFIPVMKPPQHPSQTLDALLELKAKLGR